MRRGNFYAIQGLEFKTILKSIPVRIKLSMVDLSSVAGPNVAIIFVRLSIVVTSPMVFYH